MKIAVISDIHGNAVALEAVLNDLEAFPADMIVCLGDAIQGGPQPREVTQRLRELACPVVMGNADAWLLSGIETSDEGLSDERRIELNTIRDWSLAQLSQADKDFISSFRPTIEIPLSADRHLLCFHGSPASFDELILPSITDEVFMQICGKYAPNILTGGHTHLQQLRRLGTSDAFFFNPGSVGLAYSHQQTDTDFHADPWAEYAVLATHQARISIEFRRVPYDVRVLMDSYRNSGRPFLEAALKLYRQKSPELAAQVSDRIA